MNHFPRPKKWVPTHPEKYVGDVNNIISRSSWETRFMNWCDSSPSVIYYASEEFQIPYVSPADGRIHRYFVDFLIKVKDKEGILKTYAVEIKPYSQTQIPKKKKITKRYLVEAMTYAVNQAKWKAAVEFFDKKGIEFKIITEYELGIAHKRG